MSLGSIENLNFFDENLRIQKIIFQIARCEADDDVGSWSQMHYSIAQNVLKRFVRGIVEKKIREFFILIFAKNHDFFGENFQKISDPEIFDRTK